MEKHKMIYPNTHEQKHAHEQKYKHEPRLTKPWHMSWLFLKSHHKHIQLVFSFATILAMSFWMSACGNSGKSSNSGGGGAGVAGPCINCPANVDANSKLFELTTQHNGMFKFQFTLAVFGDPTAINQMFSYYGGGVYGGAYPTQAYPGQPYPGQPMPIPPGAAQSLVKRYQGPAYINGILYVLEGTWVGNCQIPAGNYQIVNASPGTMSNGMFNISRFELAAGNIRLLAALTNAGITDFDANGTADSFWGNLYIVSGPSAYGAYGNCGDIGTTFGGY